MSGVYFLLKNNTVVYVGQSINTEKRILTHKYSGKDFDSFRVIPCSHDLLLHYEHRWLKWFNPIYNRPTGGARKGAGRKPKEPTKVIRVPVSLVPKVEKLIKQHNKKRINGKL